MIKKLRKKFIGVAMLSVFTVLTLILGSILLSNYADIKKGADERIDLIEYNGGTFPLWQDYFRMFGMGGGLSPESPFDTRYFSVRLNAAGEAVAVNTGSIAAIDRETAVELAQRVAARTKTRGFISIYRYRASDFVNGKLIIFVDSSRELSAFRSFLTAAAAAALIGLALVFILVIVFSGIVIKPIAESYEKQKRFITDASHEIKTPLAIINSANEVLELENGESEWNASISNQVQRLSELTQKLVLLSRMEEESFRSEKKDVDLSAICLEAAHSFDAVAQSSGKNYTVDIRPDLHIEGDAGLLTQLVSLLLDNAMKYSDAQGDVTFTLKRQGRSTVITVENTVEKTEKGNRNVLFERFYRSDASRSSKTGGSGIGLSVAKAIVTSHGGKISAFSPDEKRIVFTVVL